MKSFNVKKVEYKVLLDGINCVNRDSIAQKNIMKKKGYYSSEGFGDNDNFLFGKKDFSCHDGFKFKVSSQCIKHNLIDVGKVNPTTIRFPEVRYAIMASADYLEKGWLTMLEDKSRWVNKSPICITDAIETGDRYRDYTHFDINQGDGQLDTSLYNRENIGKLEYEFEGGINLQEMQFICCDDFYGRMAVNLMNGKNIEKWREYYLKCLAQNFKGFKPELKPYINPEGAMQQFFGEMGILFSADIVNDLVHRILTQIVEFDLKTSSGLLRFKSMSLIFVDDEGIKHEYEIKKKDDFNDIYFNVIPKYQEITEEEYAFKHKQFEEEEAKVEAAHKERKEVKKSKKSAKTKKIEE